MKIVYVLPGIFALTFIALILVGNLGPSASCRDQRAFNDEEYTCIVKQKYVDKGNHDFRTLLLSDRNKLFKTIIVDDTSGYFEYVKPGDSIFKSKNSGYIWVNRAKKFKIYFICK